MNYYVITDTHFGHRQMIRYCGRPENFGEQILRNLTNTLINRPSGPTVVIHLGDVCIGRDQIHHERLLNCAPAPENLLDVETQVRWWLVRGNHDRKTTNWYHYRGWDVVADAIEINAFGQEIRLTHRPDVDVQPGVLNIHGHCHNTPHHPEYDTERGPRNLLLCMEHHYQPVALRTVVERWQNQHPGERHG